MMTDDELKDAAPYLYDGGWRSTDKEGLAAAYGISMEYASKICEQLGVYEMRKAQSKGDEQDE